MKFLADMGISPETVEFLRQLSFDAKHLSEEGLYRLKDSDILIKARHEGRIVLTADLDFGYLVAISGAQLPSIILFRLADMRPVSINVHLAQVLERCEDYLKQGTIVTVTENRIRVRRLPIEKNR
ncbi:DUF5615 family PIN-like protein [bacterium]|nr:DUF5615 family PIN-like protein [bacterium]